MNGLPLKFDFTKTLNEQLSTFDYYKNRYANYEMQICNLINEKQQLIKILKDKIKEIDNEIKIKQLTQQGDPYLLEEIHELRIISLTYQEVLDFVKGGKDE